MTYKRVIFVSRLSAIGDVIMAAHAVQLLVLNGYYPVFLTAKSLKQIPESMPYLNLFVCTEKENTTQFYMQNSEISQSEFVQFIKTLPVENRPLFLDLQKTARSKRAISEIKKIIKFEKYYSVPKRTLYRIFLIFLAFIFFSQRKRTKDLNLKTIQTIEDLQENSIKKIVLRDGKEFIPLKQATPFLTQNSMVACKYICLFPGASGFVKMWPKENFRDLMNLILEQTQFKIILCGAQSEVMIGEYLDFPANDRVVNYINQTSLTQTLNLIANAKYVVTNDSFPAHAAEVFGIPATVLFGATSPKFGFAPRAEYIQIEYQNLSCSPCTRHGKGKCRFSNLKCLKEIRADSVFENMKAKINA
ncbi:MAG: glycosyltransferase family 9 protein [Bdellovibrionota bacterium]